MNINATTQLQVVLVKPDRFDLVSDIADHLRDKQAVVLNLESTNKDVARRLVDFLSGCAYALDGKIKKIVEPMVAADIITPKEFIGAVMDLCQDHRGIMGTMEYISTDRVEMHYRIPLAEIVFDFFDQLKSRTKGYASLDYHEDGEQSADLVKVDILIQGEKVDAFSAIVHRDKAYSYGVMMTKKLRSLIPRQQFEIPIQAAIGSRIIARENIRALRKDVLAKCYGGDITRKRKLLEKQKAGKKRMKMLGHVEVPQEAFIAALSTGEDSNDRDTKDKIRAAQKTEG